MTPPPPLLEKKAYGPDSNPAEIEALRCQVWTYSPGIVMYREAPVVSLFQVSVFRQRLIEVSDNCERFDLICDLTDAARPGAEERVALKGCFSAPKNLEHVAAFAGSNLLLNMAVKFILSGLGLKSVVVVKTFEEALEAIERGQK